MKKKQSKTFRGMNYRRVQKNNSRNRNKLKQEEKKWLKSNGYKNVGWKNVISLYQKIEEFLDKAKIEDLTLEELFLEADRIGNKYLTSQEIQDFNRKLSQEVNEIAEEIDKQFPETEIEIIDFSKQTNQKYRKKANRKIYTKVKL
ncbi:MAG: hypothetical protein QNJ41_27190 [Xenococcaceae cyanobacterium MO_188.B32]|nr:hypothetical protein [Xenococcaceae cyanobacterium MO_188.B32]